LYLSVNVPGTSKVPGTYYIGMTKIIDY